MHYISTLCSHIRLVGLANQRTLPIGALFLASNEADWTQELYCQSTVALRRNNHILVLNYMRK